MTLKICHCHYGTLTQDKENDDMNEVKQRVLESVADQQYITKTLDKVETEVVQQN